MGNPYETTGVLGKGKLWFEGVNYASDALILLEIDGQKNMVAVKRKSGHWAMPGGFRDRNAGPHGDQIEGPREAAFRELAEETGLLVSPRAQQHSEVAYEGYVRDPRNTDDAWIETTVFLLDLGWPDVLPVIEAGDDAQDICFLPLTPENVQALYPGHAKIVGQILEERGVNLCEDCINRLIQRLCMDDDVHTSIFTQFVNAMMRLAMDEDHGHPNYLFRLELLFLVLQDASDFIRSRLEGKLTLAELKLARARFQKFRKEHNLASAPELIDRALEAVPIVHWQRTEPRRLFALTKPADGVN